MDRRLERLTHLIGPAQAQRWLRILAAGKAQRARRTQEPTRPNHPASPTTPATPISSR